CSRRACHQRTPRLTPGRLTIGRRLNNLQRGATDTGTGSERHPGVKSQMRGPGMETLLVRIALPHLQNRKEGFLRNLHAAHALHPLLAFLLLLQEFAFAAYVAAIALGDHVFTQQDLTRSKLRDWQPYPNVRKTSENLKQGRHAPDLIKEKV